jgi:hypothetical protein
MPIQHLTAIGTLLLGSILGNPASAPAPSAHITPKAQPVILHTEISAPMFHGTVRAIDRTALRVTVQTDFGRLVPVAVGSCEILQRLHIGDHVRLDVDVQGVVRALEKTGAARAMAPTTRTPLTWQPGRCPEAST